MSPFAIGILAAAVIAVAAGHDLTPRDRSAEWPVSPPTVLRSFEPHEQFGPGHRGVDLAAAPGQLVRSTLPGVVAFAGQVAGHSAVVVDHEGDLRTTYLPVESTVRVGESVAGGEPIGRLAFDGHCGPTPCLHWGARRGDSYLDPRTLLEQGVVLLPLG